MTAKEYADFMFNADNEFRCEHCPENRGHDGNGFDHRYPCDQQMCWVTAHIRHLSDSSED